MIDTRPSGPARPLGEGEAMTSLLLILSLRPKVPERSERERGRGCAGLAFAGEGLSRICRI